MSDQPPIRKRAPRRDAQARRAAVIAAAAACFQEFGYDVPLETVAERAGVGRGTLYRNFSDREALALAIFSREVERLGEGIDADAPIEHTLATMVRESATASSLFRRIAAELHRSNANLAAFRALRNRLEQLIAPAVMRARDRGELQNGVEPGDLVTALQMVGGLLYPFLDSADIEAQISAALQLLLAGLRPR